MKQLVPIKVKIGLNGQGKHKYPNFNLLKTVQTSGLDWSQYVDVEGAGWHYDKCCGHQVNKPDSPRGEQWGCLLVPKAFADEAIALFSGVVFRLTELEFEGFHDGHAHAHEPDEIFQSKVLEGIKMKKDLGLPLTLNQQNALDPDNDTPGIVKNKSKYWKDRKIREGIKIVQ